MQQSWSLCQLPPRDEKSLRQFSSPHLRSPAQSSCLSQSPCPRVHGFVAEQQELSTLGSPLHGSGVVGASVVGVGIEPYKKRRL